MYELAGFSEKYNFLARKDECILVVINQYILATVGPQQYSTCTLLPMHLFIYHFITLVYKSEEIGLNSDTLMFLEYFKD